MKILLVLGILISLISCSHDQIELEKNQMKGQDSLRLEKYVQGDEPGIQYVLVNKDTTIFNINRGLSDVKNNIAVNLAHTMPLFSMTKTITAIAVLQLVERGEVKLDDKLSTFVEHPYDQNITIRQLISHTSGIPNPIPLSWTHLVKNHKNFDEDESLQNVLNDNKTLNHEPGDAYQYSNIGYWLLGKLIEDISHDSYTNFVNNNIFKALKISPKELSFKIEDEKQHAKGYLKRWSLMNLFGRFFIDNEVLGEYEKGWLHINNIYLNGPSFGGAIGSASATSKILQDLLSEQSLLLNDKTKKLLFSQQQTNLGKKIPMTLGWHVDKLNGETYYYKEGGGAGYHSEMRIYPQSGLGSVILVNRTSFNSRKILSELDKQIMSGNKS